MNQVHKKRNSYQQGHFSEKLAMFWLMLKGWRPVATNFKIKNGTGVGEVDLIMIRFRTIIFVEVKYRKTMMQAMEAISINQQIRVSKGAAVFLDRHPKYQKYQSRFDALLMAPNHFPKHIVNAWRLM